MPVYLSTLTVAGVCFSRFYYSQHCAQAVNEMQGEGFEGV